jgi:hypothetical protein
MKPVARLAAMTSLLALVLGSYGPSTPLDAQEASRGDRTVVKTDPTVVSSDPVGISKNLRDLEPLGPATNEPYANERRFLRVNPRVRGNVEESTPTAFVDGALQTTAPSIAIPGPTFTWDGSTVTDCNCAPPDPNGDVGPNHYVSQVNVRMRVYNKTTGALLAGPVQLSQLFASAGFTDRCATADDGDPIVLYDQLADRWLISQFAVASPQSRQCVAISRTPDPTGQWYLYSFPQPPGFNNTQYFQDYPKLGLWPDAYYMTTNQFNFAGTAFLGGGVFAFEREKMLQGLPARQVYFDLNTTQFPEGIGGMLPSDLDGYMPPPAGAPNTFVYFTSLLWGEPADGLRIFNFHVDWTNTANSTFTEFGTSFNSPLPVAPFDPRSSTRSQIPQPGTTAGLDAISDRLMHRMPYRNFGGHETLVTNHTVNVGTGQTISTYQGAPRWYELRRAGGNWFVQQQGTFAPDAQVAPFQSRWMGSAAMDASGNLMVGYSASSTALFPSIKYAGRLASDPPGDLAQGEATMFAGLGSQSGTGNRWGDYTGLVLDVDDCTFYYINQYQPSGVSTFSWRTRIGYFDFGPGLCTPPALGTAEFVVTACSGGTPIGSASVAIGGQPYGATLATGSYSVNLLPGSYGFSVAKPPVFGAVSGNFSITAGNTTTIPVCLQGVPVIEPAGSTLVAEGCGTGNGVIDPHETVTVDFNLTNVGGDSTSNLVATLQASGGVTPLSGPQSYGSIAPGGSQQRPFTFRAGGTCGGTITATLDLQDGATNLGTASYTFTLGTQPVLFTENFDGVAAPALPAGWTAVNAAGPAPLWVTSNAGTPAPAADSPPNAAFVNDPNVVSDKRLDSPSIAIPSPGAQLTFRHNHILETGFDGGVLEISIGGGAFQDILAAGGSFVTGGYTHTISLAFQSPIAGRQAWSGNSSGFKTTTVNLPAAAAGNNIVLRWRMGSDNAVAGTGWRLDNVQIVGALTCCGPQPAAAGYTLTSESCTPVNSAVDPNERVTLNLRVTNTGTGGATNLTGTLLPSAGVLAPSGPQSFGALAPGGTAGALFSFTAAGMCGGTVTPMLALEDGGTPLGTVSYTAPLGATVTRLNQNFDGVAAPALPAGWTAVNADGPAPLWVTSNAGTPAPAADSAPNAAFVDDPNVISDKRLDSPPFSVSTAAARLTFRHNHNLETGFDGGVLEISIGGGPFQDILAAGGSFVEGGYTHTISTAFANPIGGRQAWSGNSSGFKTTTVNLPAAAAGNNVVLRWRMGSDNSVAGVGWRVDNVEVTERVCATTCAAVRLAASSTFARVGADVVATITVVNQGGATANNVMLTTAQFGAVNGTPLPQALGSIPGGGSATATVTYANAPTAAVIHKVGGTYTGGSFSSNTKATVP